MTFLYILAIIVAFAVGMWVGSRDDGDHNAFLERGWEYDDEDFDEF